MLTMKEQVESLTVEELLNLRKLADYIESLPKGYEKFDMDHFAEEDGFAIKPSNLQEQIHNCGTSCCALGHAPLAKLEELQEVEGSKTDWDSYGMSIFPSLYEYNDRDWETGSSAVMDLLL